MKTYSRAQYRALTDPIRTEGPWIMANNPSRPFYPTRQGVVRFIGLHITAGITDLVAPDLSAESVTQNWGAVAGNTGASWHACTDSDSIVPGLPDHYTAWVQGASGYSFNSHGLGLEQGLRSPDWRTIPASHAENIVINSAVWCAPRIIRYNLPLVLIDDRNYLQRLIEAGKPAGFAYHAHLAPHNRRDPAMVGNPPNWIDTFPLDRFFEACREEVARRKGTVPSAPKPATTYFQVTAKELNTRSGAGIQHAVVGSAPQGTRLLYAGRTSGDWVLARTPYQVQKNLKATWWNKAWLKTEKATVTKAPATKTPVSATYPVLSLGSKGVAVRNLQSGLMKTFPAYAGPIRTSGGADGSYGNATAGVVGEFQRRTGLTPDKVCGPRTWTQLGKFGIRP